MRYSISVYLPGASWPVPRLLVALQSTLDGHEGFLKEEAGQSTATVRTIDPLKLVATKNSVRL
jgi:hypothetical protein